MYQFSATLNVLLSISAWEAQALKSEYLDVEHLFLGLCKVEDVVGADHSSIGNISYDDWRKVTNEIEKFVKPLQEIGFDFKKTRRRFREILRQGMTSKGEYTGKPTDRCSSLIQTVKDVCGYPGMEDMALQMLFISLLGMDSDSIDKLLADTGIDFLLLDNYFKLIQGLMGKDLQAGFPLQTKGQAATSKVSENAVKDGLSDIDTSAQSTNTKTKTPYLDKFGRDFTKLAKDGKFEPVIGRSDEIRKIAQILVQKNKNNLVLVGEAGVGKTCIVEGFAQRAAAPDAPELIRKFRIIEISMGSLVAGTKYRGDFEEKMEAIVREASSDPNIVLFIDEIHTMVDAGATGDGSIGAGNILKPALARGGIKCIGATTIKEYRKYFEKDPALERRFQAVWVEEPSRTEAVQILKGIKKKYEEYYSLSIPDHVIEKTVELSMRYLTDFRLPDKAIDIIDQACAKKLLKTLSPVDFGTKDLAMELKLDDIAKVISERCKIPVTSLTVEESRRLTEMEAYLKKRVMGQDRAIKEVAETIRTSRAGLGDPNKPRGIFLFLGMTGTGKTELAKALAEFLFYDEKKIINVDMSEYMEQHSVAKLIGAPPGYVGFEEEGYLTGRVRSDPFSVILFDEIEKAHPAVFDLFLQIFEEGRLTDAHGRNINFTETVIIMTSNLGSALPVSAVKHQIGFSTSASNADTASMNSQSNNFSESVKKDYESRIMHAVNGAFRPEIFNRIQKKIIFYPLEKSAMILILDKISAKLNERLKSRQMVLALEGASKDFIIEKGYSDRFGAREMQRVFDQLVSQPLSDAILNGDITDGKSIRVVISDNHLGFEIED